MLSDLDGRVEKWFALLFHSKKVWGLNPLSNLPETCVEFSCRVGPLQVLRQAVSGVR